MNKKIKKIIFSMLTAYGLGIHAGMYPDSFCIENKKTPDVEKSAAMKVVQENFNTTEKQQTLDLIVEEIIDIFNIYNYIGTEQKLKLFLESARSKDYNKIHKILTENPDLTVESIGSPKLVELVKKYREHQYRLLGEDTKVLSSPRNNLYNNK